MDEQRRLADEKRINDIYGRLNEGDAKFAVLEANLAANTTATQQIAANTAGLVRLTSELEAGTKFLCRAALGVRFILKEVVEPFWKPALIVFVGVYYVTHGDHPPQFIESIFKLVVG